MSLVVVVPVVVVLAVVVPVVVVLVRALRPTVCRVLATAIASRGLAVTGVIGPPPG
ncbi:MAG TPA: hypothetical protein VFL99_02630 [Segeticoccus sp.]|uniref:hypothetical protein n=1 Tax=Segeticoccus sp. TaxID=2706531 RepID=UPI002D806C1F|nr:hypothetical protein [Segeticoccus sp.]HET8599194.1 hypothetical protein [Segeticoccus sp.]